MLKVYIDKEWLNTQERLLPLARSLFGIWENALPTFRDEFAHNMRFENIELTHEPSECDFMYLPINCTPELIIRFSLLVDKLEQTSRRLGKPVVAEAHTNDIVDPDSVKFPFANGIYLNSSLLRSRSKACFFALPYFIPDCLKKYYDGKVDPIGKTSQATVGFCGVAAPLKTPFSKTKVVDIGRLLLTVLDDLGADSEKVALACGTNMKHAHRCKAIISLKKSNLIRADIVLRGTGGFARNEYTNLDDFNPYITEFYENLRVNLYSLCSRGTENYSIRFYETFCMGRIPVLIDTDVKLPFENSIDYQRHCVLVQKNHLMQIDQAIEKFNSLHSEKQLKSIQRENREIWCEWFSHQQFHLRFGNRLAVN